MSDSEAEVSLVSSNGTLEGFTFDQVLEILEHAAQDAIETKDYLSYSTVLDIHLADPLRFSADEREAVLQRLLDSLSGNQELVYEVGWDIPALIIPFVDSEFNFHGGIRAAPGVYKILKIFEVLALHGNAKELFLKSTELLSSLKSTDCTGNQEFAFKFFEIKLYCIFELISSSMRRIHTLYPSRFLAMAVSSFMNCLYINPTDDKEDFGFFMKRMYSFARSYTSPPKPASPDLPAEDLAKIEDDENFLQRKLLTALVTEGVYMAMRLEILGFTCSYVSHLHTLISSDQKPILDFVLDMPVMFRLNELALSFDLLPQNEFEGFLALSEKLVDFQAAASAASDEETYSGDLFEKLVVDFQNVFANCIVNAKTGSVCDALGGNLLLFTYEASSTNANDCVDVSLQQAIALTIRVIVPGIVHRSLYHRGMIDMAVFWCWYAVQRILALSSKTLELELSAVPKPIMSTFLQALLYGVTTHGSHVRFRYLTLTLLTKILSAAPEEVSYSFLINALRECPFKGAKPVLVGVLRVLIISDKKVDDICESIKSLDLKENKDGAPPLPARKLNEKSKFINLTESRAQDVLSLVDQYIELTFPKTEEALQVSFEHLSTLLGLLNLLIPLRHSTLIKPKKISDIISITNSYISEVEKKYGASDENSVLLNAVTVLRVALNRLAE